MNVEGFSSHIFWSYNRLTNIKPEIVIKQVISYGEVKDMNLLIILPRN